MAKKKKAPNRTATRSPERQVSLHAISLRHREVLIADQSAALARKTRDDLIRQALSQGHSVRAVAFALDISRQSVMQIRDQGKPKTPQGLEPLF